MTDLSVSIPLDALADLFRQIVREELAEALEAFEGRREVFTIAQAATFLGCSPGRIYNLRTEGRLPNRMEGGRAVQLREDLLGLIS